MKFASFYAGNGLNAYERACLKSWVDYGHSIELFSYDPSLILPPGVIRRNASDVIDSSKVYIYRSGAGSGSVAAFSNEFRYRLVLEHDAVWVDTDVVCLRADWPDRDYYFGWQDATHDLCNSAVLGAPLNSELINDALSRLTTANKATATYGSLGPEILTASLQTVGLEHVAAEYVEYYPISLHECRSFFDPASRDKVHDQIKDSYAVHLWNEIWIRSRIPTFLRPPVGSFMEEILARHDIEIPIEAHIVDMESIEYRDPSLLVPVEAFNELADWAHGLEFELSHVREWAASLDAQLQQRSRSTAKFLRGRRSAK